MFYGPSSYISTSMILGDGGQMLMVTEKQDHEYLENGKRYQNSDRLWGPMVMLRNPKVGKNGNFGLTHFTF